MREVSEVGVAAFKRRVELEVVTALSRPRPHLLEVHIASFPMAGGGAVANFGAVARVPVFRALRSGDRRRRRRRGPTPGQVGCAHDSERSRRSDL